MAGCSASQAGAQTCSKTCTLGQVTSFKQLAVDLANQVPVVMLGVGVLMQALDVSPRLSF